MENVNKVVHATDGEGKPIGEPLYSGNADGAEAYAKEHGGVVVTAEESDAVVRQARLNAEAAKAGEFAEKVTAESPPIAEQPAGEGAAESAETTPFDQPAAESEPAAQAEGEPATQSEGEAQAEPAQA